MQDQKLASPVVAFLQGEEQPAAAVLSHQIQAGSVFVDLRIARKECEKDIMEREEAGWKLPWIFFGYCSRVQTNCKRFMVNPEMVNMMLA